MNHGYSWLVALSFVASLSYGKDIPACVLSDSQREGAFSLAEEAANERGFSIRLTVDISNPDKGKSEPLLFVPGLLTVTLRNANPADGWDSHAQNYLNFKLADGTCPVIEAELLVQPRSAAFKQTFGGRVGIPVACMSKRTGTVEVTVHYTGPWLVMEAEGAIDKNCPMGVLAWNPATQWQALSARVKRAEGFTPVLDSPALSEPAQRPIPAPIQFFTPTGHNTWVGDVVVGTFNGVCHVFYLLDRRHHSSKGGTGGHYFEHISSPDLVHWVEHPAAVPIAAQWETIGTGTPFMYKGKVGISYGIHTGRIIKDEFLDGAIGAPAVDGPRYAIGGTYSLSDDAIHFRKSGKIVNPGQNPSFFNWPDGRLGLIADGYFDKADSPDGWSLDAKILGDTSRSVGAGDCPWYFGWNGRHYILSGFTGFWMSTGSAKGPYTDLVAKGEDIYDGLNVPMTMPFGNGRMILAGWIPNTGWGGWLAFRELVQHSDGTLGLKWAQETMPAEGATLKEKSPGVFGTPASGDLLLSLRAAPDKPASEGKSRVQIGFADGNGRRLVLEIDTKAATAQWSRETGPGGFCDKLVSGEPAAADCFSIRKIRGLDKPFTVRLYLHYDKKADSTLLDTEIAGDRTLLHREGGRLTDVSVKSSDGVALSDLRAAEVK